MREQGRGDAIQISSMGGRLTFPMHSIYHSTKWAVEGFSESLHYQLAQFDIRIKLVEPGPIKMEFYGRSREFVKPDYTTAHDGFIDKFARVADGVMKDAEGPEVLARTIFKAATK